MQETFREFCQDKYYAAKSFGDIDIMQLLDDLFREYDMKIKKGWLQKELDDLKDMRTASRIRG